MAIAGHIVASADCLLAENTRALAAIALDHIAADHRDSFAGDLFGDDARVLEDVPDHLDQQPLPRLQRRHIARSDPKGRGIEELRIF